MAYLEADRLLFNRLVRCGRGSLRDSLPNKLRTTTGHELIKHGPFDAISRKPSWYESSRIRTTTVRKPSELSACIQTPLEGTLLIYPPFLGIIRSASLQNV